MAQSRKKRSLGAKASDPDLSATGSVVAVAPEDLDDDHAAASFNNVDWSIFDNAGDDDESSSSSSSPSSSSSKTKAKKAEKKAKKAKAKTAPKAKSAAAVAKEEKKRAAARAKIAETARRLLEKVTDADATLSAHISNPLIVEIAPVALARVKATRAGLRELRDSLTSIAEGSSQPDACMPSTVAEAVKTAKDAGKVLAKSLKAIEKM